MSEAASPADPGVPPILELRDIRAGYGPIEVVHGVSLEVAAGSVMALLGPNGGGKTTMLNVCSGTLAPNSGDVCFEGAVVTSKSADDRARTGHLHGARRTRHLSQPHRAGEPSDGHAGRRADGPH